GGPQHHRHPRLADPGRRRAFARARRQPRRRYTLRRPRVSANLLIVDDSTSMRQMVAFALSSGGFNVREAEDGQAALDIARTASFDAVVTDVNMPRMDGI